MFEFPGDGDGAFGFVLDVVCNSGAAVWEGQGDGATVAGALRFGKKERAGLCRTGARCDVTHTMKRS